MSFSPEFHGRPASVQKTPTPRNPNLSNFVSTKSDILVGKWIIAKLDRRFGS